MPLRSSSSKTQEPEAAILSNSLNSSNDTRRLVVFFWAWKLLLLALAFASPGNGYDTSTRILFDQYDASTTESYLSRALERVVLRLTRWDGIYFATSSERGHVNEQEWAFSWFLTDIVTAGFAKGACALSNFEIWTHKLSIVPSLSIPMACRTFSHHQERVSRHRCLSHLALTCSRRTLSSHLSTHSCIHTEQQVPDCVRSCLHSHHLSSRRLPGGTLWREYFRALQLPGHASI